MTSHLTSIIWILYVLYRNWLNIILCVHITYYIDYYTISRTDNVDIYFFLFLRPHHSLPQSARRTVLERVEHLHGKRKNDG